MSRPYKIFDYWVLIYRPNHPRAFGSGYVPEQILVAEKELGRRLEPDEEVRHINGNTQDNRPTNLEIVTAHTGYRVQSLSEHPEDRIRHTTPSSFVPCKFQRPCWKQIRAPIARKNKVYLPYVCSYQIEGDIYKCSHFWNYLDDELLTRSGESESVSNE